MFCAFVQGMKEAGIEPNKIVYCSVIAACEDNNRWSEALAVFSDMKDSSIELDQVAMAGRNLVYKFPEILTAMPASLVTAAKLAVKSGRAARQWMTPS